MKTNYFFFALFFLLMPFQAAKSQNIAQVGFSLAAGLPLNDFKRESEVNVSGGVNGYLLFPILSQRLAERNLNLSLGLDFGYQIYGMESFDTQDFYNGNFVTVTERTTNNIVQTHALLRLSPKDKGARLQPYLEALVGGKYFFTRTVWEEAGEVYDSVEDHSDFAFSYGGGGGIGIRLSSWVYLDLRATYLRGGFADYLTEGSILPDPNNIDAVIYDIKKSRTDMLLPQLGINFKIQ
ncbi:outer membrane beta-barrel protein [Hugenholtzia roseola]|uniref:outer membrane beta-barrel protein n=1 Tax=Hugenholtzia roseola TaxID=1002 RepID=UPI00040873E2|nr:outer membrane beta-barrel protein [Hugenholtzia roseola]